jgi:hypothetical protein
MEQTGLSPKRAKENAEKSRLQMMEDVAGRGEDAFMYTTLKVLSHSTDANLNSPNCTKDREILMMPLTLTLTMRPTEDAATKQNI